MQFRPPRSWAQLEEKLNRTGSAPALLQSRTILEINIEQVDLLILVGDVARFVDP